MKAFQGEGRIGQQNKESKGSFYHWEEGREGASFRQDPGGFSDGLASTFCRVGLQSGVDFSRSDTPSLTSCSLSCLLCLPSAGSGGVRVTWPQQGALSAPTHLPGVPKAYLQPGGVFWVQGQTPNAGPLTSGQRLRGRDTFLFLFSDAAEVWFGGQTRLWNPLVCSVPRAPPAASSLQGTLCAPTVPQGEGGPSRGAGTTPSERTLLGRGPAPRRPEAQGPTPWPGREERAVGGRQEALLGSGEETAGNKGLVEPRDVQQRL